MEISSNIFERDKIFNIKLDTSLAKDVLEAFEEMLSHDVPLANISLSQEYISMDDFSSKTLIISGWRPLTQKEKLDQKKAKEREKERLAKKSLKKLLKEYPGLEKELS